LSLLQDLRLTYCKEFCDKIKLCDSHFHH